jgi:hypothetical protein
VPVSVDLSKAASYLSPITAPRFLGQIIGDKMRKVLLASVASLALGVAFAGAASASDISGTLAGSYANDTSNSGGDLWNIDGALTGRFGGDWGLEAAVITALTPASAPISTSGMLAAARSGPV